MSHHFHALQLPDYHRFIEVTKALSLPIPVSELHGVMCAYLCAGAVQEGEAYLRAYLPNKPDLQTRDAILAIFGMFAVSQQQLINFDFEFQMLLPTDDDPITKRAEAFRAWCDGFTHTLNILGIDEQEFQDEESIEALEHLSEFARLDYQSLSVTEDDERALLDVNEYTRMAILRIHHDLEKHRGDKKSTDTAH